MLKFARRHVSFSDRLLGLAIGLSLMGMVETTAAAPPNITEAEIKLLPRYCPDTQGFGAYGDAYSNTSPRAGYWVSLMGKSFWAMHHYCWAQVSMNRSLRSGLSAMERTGMRESAVADYMYVVRNSPPDFILLPEIYTRIGEAELLLKQPNRADEAFSRARELKPDYWPAYSHWAEFLMSIGRRAEALKVVAAGLQHSPNAKVLREQFRILGGKPSDIPKTAPKESLEKDLGPTEALPEPADSPTPAETQRKAE